MNKSIFAAGAVFAAAAFAIIFACKRGGREIGEAEASAKRRIPVKAAPAAETPLAPSQAYAESHPGLEKLSFDERAEMIASLDMSKAADSETALSMLRASDEDFAAGLDEARALALRNQLLDRLISSDPLPREFPEALAAVIADAGLSVKWREACVQVIPECLLKIRIDSSEGNLLLNTIEEVSGDYASPVAGAALWGLGRLTESVPEDLDEAALRKFTESRIEEACKARDVSPSTCAAALRLAARRGMKGILPIALALREEAKSEYVRRCAAQTASELSRSGEDR